MNSTEDALMGEYFYSPEGFPFQTCNKQKRRMGHAHTGVRIHSFIHDVAGWPIHCDDMLSIALRQPLPLFERLPSCGRTKSEFATDFC